MSSTAQGSNDMGRGRLNKSEKSRRCWSTKEEEILLASLKELVAQGWKSDNGFRAGYLSKLEESMKNEFPSTDLKGTPHINSKLTTWKKNYYSLMNMLSRSGIGFNLKGDHMIDCDNEQWEQIMKADTNARNMRFKSWPFLDDWKEIFGKDRATGEGAEDLMDAVNEMMQEDNVAAAGIGEEYHVNNEFVVENEPGEDSVCQSEQGDMLPTKSSKKRKVVDGIQGVRELLSQMHRDTNSRLENLASRIGYEFDLAKARKEVFELVGNIPGLSLDDKFQVCEILVDKVERLEMFMGLPDDARPQYVMRLLKTTRDN